MAATVFNLTGDNCINQGEELSFTSLISGANVSGASFESSIVRDFDKLKLASFTHEVTNSGISEVTYTLPASSTSGLDYAASSFQSIIFPTGSNAPQVVLTGITNVNVIPS